MKPSACVFNYRSTNPVFFELSSMNINTLNVSVCVSNISTLLFLASSLLRTSSLSSLSLFRSLGWLLSQQTVKCLLSPREQPYKYTSLPELPLCNVLQRFLKRKMRRRDEGSLCVYVYVSWQPRLGFLCACVLWGSERSVIYLLLVLVGWTGWSDPVWLMPVSVTPSGGFFFSRLLRVRFRSMDQSWSTHTDTCYRDMSQSRCFTSRVKTCLHRGQWRSVLIDGDVHCKTHTHFNTVQQPGESGELRVDTDWIFETVHMYLHSYITSSSAYTWKD